MSGPTLTTELERWLDPSERFLLDTIHEPFLAYARFPVFDYVDRVLYEKGLDAEALVAALPSLGAHAIYGLIRPASQRLWRPEETIQLTIAGLRRCSRGEDDVAAFMSTLQLLTAAEADSPHNPFEATQATLTNDQIARHLEAAGLDARSLMDRVRALLAFEPPDAISATGGTDQEWSVSVSRRIRRYRGISNVQEYLELVAQTFAPAEEAARPAFVSTLSLPEAMDFLDAVWELKWGARLFSLPSATSIVQLSQPCNTADEFASRLNTLTDILARMNIPTSPETKREEGTLSRLESLIGRVVAGGDPSGIDQALSDLRAVVAIRAGGTHAGARVRRIKGFSTLGLPFPPTGWAEAWQVIEARTVSALNAIREEIRRSLG
jgi:hypothetical protein